MADDSHWVIKTDDTHMVRVDSFTLDELEALADKYAETWLSLVSRPLLRAGAAQELFNMACAKSGVSPRRLSAAEAVAVFDIVSDDGVAATFVDGLPDPKPVANP